MPLATVNNQTTRALIEFCSQPDWLALPVETRTGLRKIFNIGKSGSSRVISAFKRVKGKEVSYDKIVSDGTMPEDLMKSFNVIEALKYLNQDYNPKHEYDFSKVLVLVLKKAGLKSAPGAEEVSAGPAPTSKSETARIKEMQLAAAKKALEGAPKQAIPPAGKAAKVLKPGQKKVKLSQKK